MLLFCKEIQVMLFAGCRPFEVVEQSFQTTSLFITLLQYLSRGGHQREHSTKQEYKIQDTSTSLVGDMNTRYKIQEYKIQVQVLVSRGT